MCAECIQVAETEVTLPVADTPVLQTSGAHSQKALLELGNHNLSGMSRVTVHAQGAGRVFAGRGGDEFFKGKCNHKSTTPLHPGLETQSIISLLD